MRIKMRAIPKEEVDGLRGILRLGNPDPNVPLMRGTEAAAGDHSFVCAGCGRVLVKDVDYNTVQLDEAFIECYCGVVNGPPPGLGG